jgi:hypothetical protein
MILYKYLTRYNSPKKFTGANASEISTLKEMDSMRKMVHAFNLNPIQKLYILLAICGQDHKIPVFVIKRDENEGEKPKEY